MMLGKMILQGAVAAAIIGAAAAVYAQAADAVQQAAPPQQSQQNVQGKDTGWLPAPKQDFMREGDRNRREHGETGKRKHKRDHDDDDD